MDKSIDKPSIVIFLCFSNFCAGLAAAEPTIPDIGILASTDLLAIDQASVDLVYQTASNQDLVKRMESRHGLHQLTAMNELKMGNDQYELIELK